MGVATFIIALAFAVLATSAPVLNFFYRNGYVFIDHETISGLARLIFGAMVVNACYADAVFVLVCLFGKITYGWWIGLGFSVLLSLFFLMINLVSGRLTVNQVIKAKKPFFRFKFTSGAAVYDVGTGEYSVVFGASKRSQGWITYTYKGEEKIVWSADSGVKRMGVFHACLVPRAELENNSYQIHAIRVAERLSYGSRFGKTIHGNVYNFKGDRTIKNPTLISVSDWHFHNHVLVDAASHAKPPDLVLSLGDGGDYFVNEQHTIKLIINPISQISHGEIPVIFVRGNHEVRADYDNGDFWRKLGLKDGYNYRVERGDFLFNVVDSAEAEDGQDEWEHKGCYDMGAYLERVLNWLEHLPVRSDKFNIVLIHDRNFSTPGKNRRVRYAAALKRLGVQFGVSGDSHAYNLTPRLHDAYPCIEDGGAWTRSGGAKHLLDIFSRAVHAYTLAQIEFTDSTIEIVGIDDLGNNLKAHTIQR